MANPAPLRSLDWRFLLPLPPGDAFDHLLLIGGAPGQAALCQAIGLARSVSEVVPTEPASVDAVAILSGGLESLPASLPALRTGGVAYVEASRRSAARPDRLKHRLQALGLGPPTVYGVWPSFTVRELYLPLANPSLIRWYFDALSGTARSVRPVLARLSQWLTQMNPRWLFPLLDLALVCVQGPGPANPTFMARAALPALEPAGPPLLLTPGPHDFGRVAAFAGAPAAERPVAVLKCWRSPDQNAVTDAELDTLSALHAPLDERMRRTVPAPLGGFAFQGLRVMAETCAPGRSAGKPRDPWEPIGRHVADLRLAGEWLSRFHRQVQLEQRVWTQADVQEWVVAPLSALQEYLPTLPHLADLFAHTIAAAQRLVGSALPVVWVHWGFADRNLFRTAGGLFVIDWEAASPGPPLYDLHYYVIHWYLNVTRARGLAAESRAVGRLFGEPPRGDPAVAAVHAVLADYQRAIGLHPGCVPVFLVSHLAERVLGRIRRQGLSAEAAAALVAHSSYTHYLAALAERRAWLLREAHGTSD